MRSIVIHKDTVGSNFIGYDHIIYSVVNYDGGKVGRIIRLHDNAVEIRNLVTDDVDKVSYNTIQTVVDNGREPAISLKKVESIAWDFIDYYSKNSVTIDGSSYTIPEDVKISVDYETELLSSSHGVAAVTALYDTHYVLTISIPYLQYAPANDIKGTILHEIAHMIAGRAAKHGPLWKDICIKIGGLLGYDDNTPNAYLKAQNDFAGPNDVYGPGHGKHIFCQMIVEQISNDLFQRVLAPNLYYDFDLKVDPDYYAKLLTTNKWSEYVRLLKELFKLVSEAIGEVEMRDESQLTSDESAKLDKIGSGLAAIESLMPGMFPDIKFRHYRR